jgi:hypothetical protein
MSSRVGRSHRITPAAIGIVAALIAVACEAGAPTPTPPIVPGDAARPREVNIIAKDDVFLPDALDLVPGETVLLHVINGGLQVHEAVIGDAAVQDAWETAEAATVGAPPGPTPQISVPPEVAGLRIVVRSGERVDVTWTIPAGAGAAGGAGGASGASGPAGATSAWIVGCHIPGHWARGMRIPVRWVPRPS